MACSAMPASSRRRRCTTSGSRSFHSSSSARCPVPLGVAFVVPVPPVRGGLDDDGSGAGADRTDDLGHDLRRRHDVVAVDGPVAHAVPLGAVLERRGVLIGGCGELGVAVVLAEEDDRELPHRGQVHGLVERALGHRAVAEERDREGAVAPELGGGGRSDGDREPGGDDAVRAEDADRGVGDVHRSAAPAVRALVLAHQLGEHAEGVEPLRQAVPVAAVGGRDHVVGTERPAGADGRGLLPDRQVHEAGNGLRPVEDGHALLEAADHEHAPVQLEQVVVRGHGAVLY